MGRMVDLADGASPRLVHFYAPFTRIPMQLLLYLYRTEIHVEIQFYKRGWVKSAIRDLHPLAPAHVCPLTPPGYNTTLANAPNLLSLSPGIALRQDNDCFHFASTLPSVPIEGQTLPEHTIYHTYWRVDLRPLAERQMYFLSSLLFTQSDEHSSVVLWTNDVERLQTNAVLQPLLSDPRFQLKQADLTDLSRGTPLENTDVLSAAVDEKAWLDGDLVRVLLLYRFGGVWVDMDFLALRDFRPLLEQEWLVQWDCYDKPYTPLNGAVMHFYKASPYLCEMLWAMVVEPAPKKASTDWGSLLYYKVWRRLLANGRKPFAVLPWCLMDPRNCQLDNRIPDPFEKDPKMHPSRAAQLEKQVSTIVSGWSQCGVACGEADADGQFALHLHNQWDKAFPLDGWVNRLILPKVASPAMYLYGSRDG